MTRRPSAEHPRSGIRFALSCALLALVSLTIGAACGRDDSTPASAASSSAAAFEDTVGAAERMASDASLRIVGAARAAAAVRVVADSFAAREAVRVILDVADAAMLDSTQRMPAFTPDRTPDLVLTAESLARPGTPPGTREVAPLGTPTADTSRYTPDWRIRFGSDSTTAFALSIPSGASNGALAERFVRYLLSPAGRAILAASGVRVPPRVIAVGSALPDALASLVDTTFADSTRVDSVRTNSTRSDSTRSDLRRTDSATSAAAK